MLKKEQRVKSQRKRGWISVNKMQADHAVVQELKNRFIAFDVETTGLSPKNNKIIEVAAVLFENGKITKKYGTLVNPEVTIPYSATAINHITNEMIKYAPKEELVYAELVDFLGDALNQQTAICAHNASFDMNFLSETLMRLGYNGKIRYIDTLFLSRSLVKRLYNYKQDTVAMHFGLVNSQSHRAVSDAEICGKIFWNLLKIKEEEQEKVLKRLEKNKPREEELLEAAEKRRHEADNCDTGENIKSVSIKTQINRKDVTIQPIHNRVPLSNIRNKNNWEKGFEEGYPLWEQGDSLRKEGDFESAIRLFDQARYNGYDAPALYISYAMAYRKLKDYDNEIDILDEGIERERKQGVDVGKMTARRDKAVQLLLKQQESRKA